MRLLLTNLLLIISFLSYGQSRIWTDNFNNENGKGYSIKSSYDTSGIDWTISSTRLRGDAKVRKGSFEVNNIRTLLTWQTKGIAIACFTNVSIDVSLSESGKHEPSDYINVYYRLAQGSWTLFESNGKLDGDFNSVTATQDSLNGDSLYIRIEMQNNNKKEFMNIDAVTVSGNSSRSLNAESPVVNQGSQSYLLKSNLRNCSSSSTLETGFLFAVNRKPDFSSTIVSLGSSLQASYELKSYQNGVEYYVSSFIRTATDTLVSQPSRFTTRNGRYNKILISEIGFDATKSALPADSNKGQYIELYNKSADTLTLSDFSIVVFFNGAGENSGQNAWFTLPNQQLLPGKTFVIAASHGKMRNDLRTKADYRLSNNAMKFDLNDAIALYTSSGLSTNGSSVSAFGSALLMDLFGRIGDANYNSWFSKNSSGIGTFIRKSLLIEPCTVNPQKANFSNWNSYNFRTDSLNRHYIEQLTSGGSILGDLSLEKLSRNAQNASDSLSMNDDLVVRKKLVLKNGDILLNDYGFWANASALSKGNSSSYLKINGNGRVHVNIDSKNTWHTIPTGRNPYLPIRIRCTDCEGVEFEIGVNPDAQVYANPETLSTAQTTNAVGEMWTVIADAPVSGTIEIEVQWPVSSELAGFNRNLSNLSYWIAGSSSSWQIDRINSAAGSGTEIGSYTQNISLNGFQANTTYYFGVGSPGSPLPVELSQFEAYYENDGAQLLWETASETNNDYFEVQHSQNGRNWNSIGRVKGMGTRLYSTQYSFFHPLTESGTHYFRLKQMDFNGEHRYSQVRRLELNGHSLQFEIYPNPVVESLHVANAVSGTPYALCDLNGRVISSGVLHEDAKIDLSSIARGNYFLRIGNSQLQIVKP